LLPPRQVGQTTAKDGQDKEEEMLGKTHKIRRTGILLALGAAIASFAVPAALGSGFDGRSPDTRDAAAQAQLERYAPSDAWLDSVVLDGRSPDTKDAAARAQLQAHNPGDGWYYRFVPLDGRSPDTRDAAVAAQRALLAPLDGRSPDTKDAALTARYQTVSIAERRFDWGDFGIGIAAAVGGLLLLTALGAGLREARQVRHRLGNA
jgi:hypothetical protein